VETRRFKPIRRYRVSEDVSEQLKEAILLGQFKTGDKLPSERDLAEEFEASRVAIREALRTLENSGFIAIRQGPAGGAFVTDLTFEHLADTYLDLFLANKISIPELYQLRLLVEPEVARAAAQNTSPKYAARLQAALDAEELPLLNLLDDIDRKMALHFILAEMCGNRFFEGLVRSMMRLTRRVVEAVSPDPRDMHPGGWHGPVVEAVLRKDAEAAFVAMRHHTMQFGERLMKMERSFREKHSLPALENQPGPQGIRGQAVSPKKRKRSRGLPSER
jgi:DNA-binding FadR family transcriptional regulator